MLEIKSTQFHEMHLLLDEAGNKPLHQLTCEHQHQGGQLLI